MKQGKLTKITHLEDAFHGPEELAFVTRGETYSGRMGEAPVVGEEFYIGRLRTSIVKKIIPISKDNDKIVIPEKFAKAISEFPDVKDGDLLLVTMNSLYWLHDVKDAGV